MSLSITVSPFFAVILDNVTAASLNGSTTTPDPTTSTAILSTTTLPGDQTHLFVTLVMVSL